MKLEFIRKTVEFVFQIEIVIRFISVAPLHFIIDFVEFLFTLVYDFFLITSW